MASLAERPECPSVDVFASVAAKARCPYLNFRLYWSLMTRKAVESVMRSVEAKMRTSVVIKVPLPPVLSVVTLLAKRT